MTGVAVEALDLVVSAAPDIVLLDLRMGETSGLEILRDIRKALPDQRVIIHKLTPREMDILSHIAKGESNKHIAAELGIVDGTVKLHVRQVLKKLGVQTRVQAALLAVSEQLCIEHNDDEFK